MLRIYLSLLFALTLLTAACGYGSNSRGSAPNISNLTPNMTTAGDPMFTLTVSGTGFGADSVVFFDGTALPTTYGTSTRVTATVSPAQVMNAGAFPVSVRSGSKSSNMIDFTVQ